MLFIYNNNNNNTDKQAQNPFSSGIAVKICVYSIIISFSSTGITMLNPITNQTERHIQHN